MTFEERVIARLESAGRCSCEPATIATIGFAGVGLAGSVIQGQSEVAAAKFGVQQAEELARHHEGMEAMNSELARRNVALTDQAAADAHARGSVEAARMRADGTRLIGTQRAGFAAGGVDVGSGSALDVTADTRMITELDAQTIRNNAAREAWGYKAQGAEIASRDVLARAEGRFARHQLRQQAQLDLQRARSRRAGVILGGVASFGGTVARELSDLSSSRRGGRRA